MTRVLLATFMLLACVDAMADASVQAVRAYAALFRVVDDKFNSKEKPCEPFVPGFSQAFASSRASQDPDYSMMREIGGAELEKLNAPDVRPGDELADSVPDLKLDAESVAKINEARREARVQFEKIRLLPVNEQTCRNFLKMLP